MRTTVVSLALAGCLLGSVTVPSLARADGGLYGTVTTRGGNEYTGAIRWDKNENYWDDLLDASKQERVTVGPSDGLDLKVFGVRINKRGSESGNYVYSQFSIPMGHLRAIEVDGSKATTLELKNGDHLEVREGGDLGGSMRGMTVAVDGHEVEIAWDELSRVTFAESPTTLNRDADRLYGTLETRVGDFTGFIVWDKDESLASDILNGDEDGESHKIPFDKIASIERLGSSGSRVTLHSGSVLELEDSNDVDDDNRGIDVTIVDLGKISVPWDEFVRVTFADPPASPTYSQFDGGYPLYGTVTDQEGVAHTGTLAWDQDEVYSWESLDGRIKDVEFAILFEHIARIDRESRSAARVTLRDGLELTLGGSNDVNQGNKGIVIMDSEGVETVIDWSDLRDVTFAH